MNRIAYMVGSVILLAGCDSLNGVRHYHTNAAHVAACWNDSRGKIKLTLNEPDGTVRQFTLDPDNSPACNIWYSRNRWDISMHKDDYSDWVVEGIR